MVERGSDLNRRIADRVRSLRASAGLSLDALAGRSGVSRSMISLVERGESSPTAAVLEKLASGLGVILAALFDAPTGPGPAGPVSRRGDQAEWRDPGSGYVRRNVSPPGAGSPIRIVEVRFPAGGRVAFENGGFGPTLHQQVWVLEGEIDVTAGEARFRLREGDCLAIRLDRPTMFHNPSATAARYAVVVAPGTSEER